VLGQAPLAELSSYQLRLNAMTGGQGRYTLALSHYEQCRRRSSSSSFRNTAAPSPTERAAALFDSAAAHEARSERGQHGGARRSSACASVPERLAVRNSTTTGTIGSNEPITAHHRPMRRL
jgi:hypothetical protein